MAVKGSLISYCLILHLFPWIASHDVPMSELLTGSRPIIVLIMADDMGWDDPGANWPNTLDTPFLDHLAATGLRLPDCHSGASVCSVS